MFVATVVVSVLLALAALASGAAKLSRQPKLMESLAGLGVPVAWLPRLAGAEIAGALGLLLGLRFAPLGILAAAGLVAYFVGAVITHVRADDSEIAAPAALAVLSAVALVLRVVTM